MHLKIGVIGNLANVGYNITTYLSDIGIDAKLILHPHEILKWKQLNPNINYNSINTLEIIPKTVLDNKFTRRISEILFLNRYDVIISVAIGGIWSLPFIRKPVVCYATGSDLRELAAGIGYKGLQVFLAKRAFKQAKLVFYSPDLGHIEMIDKLHLKHVIPWKQFVNTDFWKLDLQIQKRSSVGLKIFHPTALTWIPKFPGQSLKCNNLLFEGFRLFLDRGGIGTLHYLKRGQNISETEALIDKLDLKQFCFAVGENLNMKQLKSKMLNADVIVDQFHPGGGFGLITLEAMALGKPVIVGLTDDMMKLAYPPPSESPPIIQAFSKDEIANQLLSLQDVIILKEKGTSSRNWILNNHEPVKLAHWYMREIKKVLDKIS